MFITFTANPKWVEIQRELRRFPGQTASDRPDIVSRVFDLKVKELLKDLKTRNIFGECLGLVRTIEYQKRGLPHMHLLLFLSDEYKVDRTETIDQIITAEIPSKEADPELFEIITKSMVHGPCGAIDPNSPCMIKDEYGNVKCSKGFPKQLSETTIINEDGYPTYKRSYSVHPSSKYSIKHPHGHSNQYYEIDNSWIVPYNPYLSKKYKAHINVECCQSVRAIKYINKYVYKGSDRTTIRLQDTNNEVARYLEGRYIGPTEAFARIFEYKMHEESPTVTTLSLHLPNQQPVYLSDNSTKIEIRETLENSTSMLLEYFKYYRLNPLAKKYLYQDFPKHFVWFEKKEVKEWRVRKQGEAIGRIPYCTPSCGERYYLRLLLINISGSRSFDDIMEIDGHQCATFKEACVKLHLIDDDKEWTKCFDEAILFSSGYHLRNLLFTALTFGGLVDPPNIWNKYKDSICDDLTNKLKTLFPNNLTYQSTDADLFYEGLPSLDYGLYLIQSELEKVDHRLADYNMPAFKYDWSSALNERDNHISNMDNSLISEQLSYDTDKERSEFERKYTLFNSDQKQAFDRVITQLESVSTLHS